jgi:hypothetical protein
MQQFFIDQVGVPINHIHIHLLLVLVVLDTLMALSNLLAIVVACLNDFKDRFCWLYRTP